MLRKRTYIPIEQRNYSLYYLVFSGLLFVGTMWAVVDEVSVRRPWKDHQREFRQLMLSRVDAKIEEMVAELDSLELADLMEDVEAARRAMEGDEYRGMTRSLNAIQERLNDVTREYQFAKSRGDEAYYFHKKSLLEGKEDRRQKELLQRYEAEMRRHQAESNVLTGQRDSLRALLDVYRTELRTAQNKLSEFFKPIEFWQMKRRRVESATIEVRQVMMLDYDRNPFNDPKARVDRCQTCHLGWNEEVMTDAPQPYRQHPVKELLEIHNPEVYGCTPCHRGQGPALTAGFAHGDEDHYWQNPLLRGVDVYASCNECHENESMLKYAAPFTRAKRLMIESGCHGCHEIKGYADLPKVGPELGRISRKTTPEWVFSWIKNPKDYNVHTRMPDFRLSDEEAEAVTAYLFNTSRKVEFTLARGEVRGGDARRGRTVFETAGCLACHVVGEHTQVRKERGTSYDIAPELSRVGSKVNADWVYDWLRNPRHYNPSTRMPSMRATDAEARDLVAYLMSLRDERERRVPPLDIASPAVIDKGERVIREYGCSGCHAIPGFEKEGRVSVSLSNFGRKLVEEMDFGDTKVPHTWHDWVYNKLMNSRVFATDRIDQKMPVFAFSEEEIRLLRMFLLAQTKDEPDPKYVRTFDKRQNDIERGRRLAISYNCQQCHDLEDHGGYIKVLTEETAFHPPPITGQGAKVQEQWLYAFLQNPTRLGQRNSVRPWIPTRMPTFQFTEDEIAGLMKYFLGLSNQEFVLRDYASFAPNSATLSVGRQIFTDFQCMKCHPTGDVIARPGEATTADLAPNLLLAAGRLKPEWVVDWLANPGKIQPGTRMPTFWPDGVSPLPDVLDGDAQKQMKAVRDHLFILGQSRAAAVAR